MSVVILQEKCHTLSQAAACHGKLYDITYGVAHNETHEGCLPQLQDGNDN